MTNLGVAGPEEELVRIQKEQAPQPEPSETPAMANQEAG